MWYPWERTAPMMARQRETCYYSNFFAYLWLSCLTGFDSSGTLNSRMIDSMLREDFMKIKKVKRVSRGMCKCKSSC